MSSLKKQINLSQDGADVKSIEGDEVPAPQQALSALGWRRVLAKTTVCDFALAALIQELHRGDYSHTWRWFDCQGPEECHRKLCTFEQSNRETTIYYYYGETTSGELQLFGAATIADRVNKSFLYTGFPVVSRCYILEKFRNNRLYSSLLGHRIEVCIKRLGDKLKGIHIGTSNPRVGAALSRSYFDRKFYYIGKEALSSSEDILVNDFVHLSPSFCADLTQSLQNLTPSEPHENIQNLFSRFFADKADETFYVHLLQNMRRSNEVLKYAALREFITLLSSIPVMEISERSAVRDPEVILQPRKKTG